ncbi:MAG: FliM/FliN family flagellar motor switch protein [Arcobacteraceae bacterium]|nr:FliM/FliN family flagellar motor switch protein [Arcobacteraceae bacterium]
MASDLSNIIKDDISSTLESLLSQTASITSTKQAVSEDLEAEQCICVNVDFEFSAFETVRWNFYIPTLAATKFEFLMLGGIGDLKETIDDEIADAMNEIVSNMCGSMSTNINAQAFEDLGTAKFSIDSSEVIQCDENKSLDTMFKFDLQLGDDTLKIFLGFNPSFIPYISSIATGVESPSDNQEVLNNQDANIVSPDASSASGILSLIGDESVENLKLLFDIKFKLSIRLGVKVLLLKDILNWDTGTIIELEQMVNEPLDILANGIKIGEGEAVIVEGRFGVKIKYIGNKKIEY